MPNLLHALITLSCSYQSTVEELLSGNNRANNMGEGLERYIQDLFAGTQNTATEEARLKILSDIFSYQGNRNNPPDLMLKKGDAIEIKKIGSKNATIALNSSYPKARLYADSPMITKACRECEVWDTRDMLYVVGYVQKHTLRSLWFVYGDCFCADKEVYEHMKKTISHSITSVADVDFTTTNEFAKVKKIDPLGVTDLRIRGMWHIENPTKIFDYLIEYDDMLPFQLYCLLKTDKYLSFEEKDRNTLEEYSDMQIKDVQIKNPNNPIQLIDAKLLTLKVMP